MQLLYVLACFPPYEPHTLGSRLAGLGVGVLLLVLAEAVVLPNRDPVRYPALLADAVDAVRSAGAPGKEQLAPPSAS
jgi:hypothetical protein